MARPRASIWNWAALNIQGDVADYTCYRDKRGDIVFFPKMPPEVPASPRQVVNRNRFRAAAADWRALPPSTRAAWQRATLRACCRITGYNLWTYWWCTEDAGTIRTIERQSGETLLT